MKIVYSEQANKDIERLKQSLHRRDPRAAAEAASRIRKRVRDSRRDPYPHPTIEGLDPEFRKLVIPYGSSGYVARYFVDDFEESIVVLKVYHQNEDPETKTTYV